MKLRGFTIVELIIVMVVIAILATVGTVAYMSFRKDAYNSEAKAMVFTVTEALERYYRENNEYPSSASLAGGGNGRALSTAQYNAIANTLKISPSVLQSERYKFMPCVVSGAPCTIGDDDGNYVIYMTRMPSDVSANTERTYKMAGNGCDYIFPASTVTAENGYSAYYLAYLDPTDDNWWTKWHVYRSNFGKVSRGAWCPLATT